MQRFRIRLNFIFVLIIGVLLLLLGLYFAKMLQNTYIDVLEERLIKEARIISDDVLYGHLIDKTDILQQRMKRFSEEIGARITVMDHQGKVIADTEHDPKTLPNHANRPEIRAALQSGEGQSIRHSNTLNYDMLYVAVPLKREGNIEGVVRVSITITRVQETVRNLWVSLGGVLVLMLLLFGFISTRITKSITQPIEEITRVARRITKKEFKNRIRTNVKGEIGQLAQAINYMAVSLEQQMSAIQENEKRLESILNNMFSGMILISDSRRIVMMNAAAEKLLGYEAKNFMGHLHTEIGKSSGLSLIIDRCLETGEKIREEIHVYYPEEHIIDANLGAYTNEDGEIKGVIVLLHDITAIRRLEKMRSEFVANVSHELKTPITSIKGFTETLLDGALEDAEISRSFLTIINEESDRLNRLITDILDLSKIEQKRMPLKVEEINLDKLIKETVRIIREEARAKNIAIYLPTEKNLIIEGDKDRIQQIILNLVSNAINYTPDNGEVTITLQERDSKSIEMKIADTGIGIPPEHISRIFERFYRVDKARSRESGGTGLGLAIVKHLIDSHHGMIHVESEEGRGTTFTVILPRRQVDHFSN
ncbi:two-component system histidine kinase PnpS [Aneurinibacillus aneurinilyticus]|uniref:histidine kinase n=1 Tax=Aneurinibacillus aneurinilyticus ATCC 12856 TaxID=649747 RepID=U1Y8X9_ANEAE|nr:ATP-binding protein [Aneurinibacillus aneurinilyticus]ERI08617.1 putative alkaline phosphatase synthesis sensor protein PhoR [Aneurinibacillus aneurinilyticus ATCC 12856]MED0706142.1 ATP-binding protein [Aneurinibacillus aneurinilyticus]MED0725116.1 ATP-binding protein [Aneurinibacillus aneurinilyticus]MED0732716.1 ATP-binding protein [Aneurinibacillus aneurinilyticus]MED0739853.1 ATP-binding protein [Aneurinibacillus aneurinilyticus]